ncbi:hypothetical protein HYU93_04070 [Candidatus Daviesbacteria bacterium]|nr:hypothetical protein [Candidatus Daviesbacteria bacterium]
MIKRLSWSWKLFLGITLTEVLLFIIGLNNNTQTSDKIYTGFFLVIVALAAFYVYQNRNYFNRKS